MAKLSVVDGNELVSQEDYVDTPDSRLARVLADYLLISAPWSARLIIQGFYQISHVSCIKAVSKSNPFPQPQHVVCTLKWKIVAEQEQCYLNGYLIFCFYLH